VDLISIGLTPGQDFELGIISALIVCGVWIATQEPDRRPLAILLLLAGAALFTHLTFAVRASLGMP
jgi:hypothetical protein